MSCMFPTEQFSYHSTLFDTLNVVNVQLLYKKEYDRHDLIKGLFKVKQFKKSELPMEVGGWVQFSLGFLFGKIVPKLP